MCVWYRQDLAHFTDVELEVCLLGFLPVCLQQLCQAPQSLQWLKNRWFHQIRMFHFKIALCIFSIFSQEGTVTLLWWRKLNRRVVIFLYAFLTHINSFAFGKPWEFYALGGLKACDTIYANEAELRNNSPSLHVHKSKQPYKPILNIRTISPTWSFP